MGGDSSSYQRPTAMQAVQFPPVLPVQWRHRPLDLGWQLLVGFAGGYGLLHVLLVRHRGAPAGGRQGCPKQRASNPAEVGPVNDSAVSPWIVYAWYLWRSTGPRNESQKQIK